MIYNKTMRKRKKLRSQALGNLSKFIMMVLREICYMCLYLIHIGFNPIFLIVLVKNIYLTNSFF